MIRQWTTYQQTGWLHHWKNNNWHCSVNALRPESPFSVNEAYKPSAPTNWTVLSDEGTKLDICTWQLITIGVLQTGNFYRPQRSWAKVMFLQACVCPWGEGCLPQCMLGYPSPLDQTPQTRHHPPGPDTIPPRSRHPPRTRHHPQEQTPPRPGTPPGADPSGSRLQHMVNERPVRILLECILVLP